LDITGNKSQKDERCLGGGWESRALFGCSVISKVWSKKLDLYGHRTMFPSGVAGFVVGFVNKILLCYFGLVLLTTGLQCRCESQQMKGGDRRGKQREKKVMLI
jgi:hypothetical protein